MEVAELIGKHVLSGVDITTAKIDRGWPGHKRMEECNRMLFELDGITYVAQENPDDGYRSFMDDIFITDERPSNVFPPCEVVGTMRRYAGYNTEAEGLIDFIDIITGKPVLSVGTDWSDSYYPYAVFEFMPENMAINAGRNNER